jgi:hypothetical protein
MRAAVDYRAGHADAGRIDAYCIAEKIGACGFETGELGCGIDAFANGFDRFAREAEKSQVSFRTTDVAGQD